DQLLLGELSVALDPAEEVVELLARLRLPALGVPVAPDPLDLAELLDLMLADGDHALDHGPQALVIHFVVVQRVDERRGELPRLDPAREVDLLRRRQQRHLPDLLEVHADRVVGRCLQQVDVETGGHPGLDELVAGDLDDLDPLAAQVLLHLGEELLHLLRGEVLDGHRLEQVLGGHEPALASAGGDRLLGLLQTQIPGRFGQRVSSRAEGMNAGKCTRRTGWRLMPDGSVRPGPPDAPSAGGARRPWRSGPGTGGRTRRPRSWGWAAEAARGSRRL